LVMEKVLPAFRPWEWITGDWMIRREVNDVSQYKRSHDEWRVD